MVDSVLDFDAIIGASVIAFFDALIIASLTSYLVFNA